MLYKEEIEAALDALLSEGLVSEVLHVVSTGKEALVYCCSGPEGLIAAKVYKPIRMRAFRDDAGYQMGRGALLASRDRRATARKTEHGRDVQFGAWIEWEYQTLRLLHAAGADVPRPISRSRGAMLMEYVGEESAPAPMLSRVSLAPDEAEAAFQRIVANVALWLRNDRVHGDLSPFNILYWNGSPKVIDFPQAVDARSNRNARELLHRDLDNVCRYFARAGIDADAFALAERLWRRYLRAEL
jgi:RIO kinase 1